MTDEEFLNNVKVDLARQAFVGSVVPRVIERLFALATIKVDANRSTYVENLKRDIESNRRSHQEMLAILQPYDHENVFDAAKRLVATLASINEREPDRVLLRQCLGAIVETRRANEALIALEEPIARRLGGLKTSTAERIDVVGTDDPCDLTAATPPRSVPGPAQDEASGSASPVEGTGGVLASAWTCSRCGQTHCASSPAARPMACECGGQFEPGACARHFVDTEAEDLAALKRIAVDKGTGEEMPRLVVRSKWGCLARDCDGTRANEGSCPRCHGPMRPPTGVPGFLNGVASDLGESGGPGRGR